MNGLQLFSLLGLPVAQECPSEAEACEPGFAAVVGIVRFANEHVVFNFEVVVFGVAIATVNTDAELAEFDAQFEFGVESHGHGAVVAVAGGNIGARAVEVFKVEVGGQVEVDEVEAEAHRRNQVDEGVFAKELPAEHPVGAVAEPAHVVEGELHGIAVSARVHVRGARTFGHLGGHEVHVDPGEELLVLGTDVHVESDIVVVELAVFEFPCVGGLGGVGVACGSHVSAVHEGGAVHVGVEIFEHSAEIAAKRNEAANLVLFIELLFGVGKGACGKGKGAD